MLGISANSKHPDVAIDFARFVTNEKNQIEFDKKASVFPSAKGGLDDDYYKSIDESTLEGKALKITLDQVKDGYGSRPSEFTDNNGSKNFQQQIALDEGSRTEQCGVGESKPESVECRKDDEYKHNRERWQNKQVGGNDGAEATRFHSSPIDGACSSARCS